MSAYIKKTLPFFLVGFASIANASSCNLNGVSFENLATNQITALKNVGASCDAPKSGGFSYYDEAYYVINGSRVDPLDVKASDPYDLDGSEAEFYGYIGYIVSETPRNKVWGYRFDSSLEPGKLMGTGNYKYLNSSSNDVPLLFVANSIRDTVESAKADRIRYYKALNSAKSFGAAVKVTGKFRTFSNTGDLYFDGSNIEILAMKP
jgi:hypothetical protein